MVEQVVSVYEDASFIPETKNAIGAFYIMFDSGKVDAESYSLSLQTDSLMSELIGFEIMLIKMKKMFKSRKNVYFHFYTDCKLIYDVINDFNPIPILIKDLKKRKG